MKYMKILVALLTLVMFVSAFVACSNKEGENSDASAETTTSDTTDNNEEAEPSASIEGEILYIPTTNSHGVIPDEDELEIMTVYSEETKGTVVDGDAPVSNENEASEPEKEELPSIDIEDIIIDATGAIELPFVPAQ